MANDDAVRRKTGETDPGNGAPGGLDDAAGASRADADTGTADPTADPESGRREIERLRAEVGEFKDKLLRDRAELENFKRRQARDKAEALRFANEGLLRDLLPVIDNLHRAVEHARTSRDCDAIANGVEMTIRALSDTLERHGVRIVEAQQGRPFDPAHHEAVAHVESEHPANTVVDEHQRGYLLHDRLLRPALVTVGKGKTEETHG
jgi:molecular chaperone GrpE